jgi:hypothetical protein
MEEWITAQGYGVAESAVKIRARKVCDNLSSIVFGMLLPRLYAAVRKKFSVSKRMLRGSRQLL